MLHQSSFLIGACILFALIGTIGRQVIATARKASAQTASSLALFIQKGTSDCIALADPLCTQHMIAWQSPAGIRGWLYKPQERTFHLITGNADKPHYSTVAYAIDRVTMRRINEFLYAIELHKAADLATAHIQVVRL